MTRDSASHLLPGARWIWTDDDPDKSNVWIYARRRARLAARVPATLRITADLRYVLWVNGTMVGFGPPKMDKRFPTVDAYDITPFLGRDGRVVIVVLVFSLGDCRSISSVMPRRGGLAAVLESGGRTIPTDRLWKARRETAYREETVWRGDLQPPIEVFDARRSLGDVWSPDYDDREWAPAVELGRDLFLDPIVAFEARDIPLIPWSYRAPVELVECGTADFGPKSPAIGEVAASIAAARRRPVRGTRMVRKSNQVALDARRIPAGQGLYARWDMGVLCTGYPVIEAEGTPGTVIDLSYAEHLSAGRVDPAKHLAYFDRLILGRGPLRHRIMWPKCCRYLQADVQGGRAVIRHVGMEVSGYPVVEEGACHTSDPVLDAAWRISARGLRLCMDDSYMDTPWRERGSWLGDGLVETWGNYYAFGDLALARRFIRLLALGVREDGSMVSKYPGNVPDHLIFSYTPMFALLVENFVRYGGDERFVGLVGEVLRRNFAWAESLRTADGLYEAPAAVVTEEVNRYTFIDWAPVDTRGANAAFNAILYASFRALSRLAGMNGDRVLAERARTAANDLRRAFRQFFWDEKRGVFVNGWHNGRRLARWGCHENYLALLFHLATPSQSARITRRLKKEDLLATFLPDPAAHRRPSFHWAIAVNEYRWDSRRMVPLGTPWFAFWACLALGEAGLISEALGLIRCHWGQFLRQGATSTWECWSPTASHSHGWGCAPLVILGRYILGARPDEERAGAWEVFPARGDLERASGRVPTPAGPIAVSWQFDGRWKLEIDVPPGVEVTAGLPVARSCRLAVDGRPAQRAGRFRRNNQIYLGCQIGPGLHVLEEIGRVSPRAGVSGGK